MRIKAIIVLMLVELFSLHAQPLHLTPELSYTLPAQGFEAGDLLRSERGLRYGLHIDKMWGKFGLGLYGGFGLNDFTPRNVFPTEVSGNVLNYRTFSNFAALRWKGYQAAIGPVLQLGRKFNLELYTKAGATIFDYREYEYHLSVREPIEREYTLFKVNSVEDEKPYHLFLLSGLRANIPLSRRMQLGLGVDYTHTRDVRHSYTFLDAAVSPSANEAEVVEILSTAPTVTEVRECHFNTIGLTVGITFRLGKRRPRQEDPVVDTPLPTSPSNPDFSCNDFTYQAPGFNDVYTLREKNRVTFEWEAANIKGANYELVLYKRDGNGNYLPIHRTATSQNRHTLNLNTLNGISNNELFWEINTLVNGADYCPYLNTKMRIHVFRDKAAAEKELPGCKL